MESGYGRERQPRIGRDMARQLGQALLANAKFAENLGQYVLGQGLACYVI
jgi:hypothetical protein